MLRIRTKETRVAPATRIGYVDYVCFSPWSTSKSNLAGPLWVSAESGVERRVLSIDENHGARERYDVGGPLVISSVDAPLQVSAQGVYHSGPGILPWGASTHTGTDGSDWRIRYTGGFQLSPVHWGDWPGEAPWPPEQSYPFLNDDDLSSLGNRAYGRLRPKVAHASLFQSLAEAKDIPRTLKTSLSAAAKTWGTLVDNAHVSDLVRRDAMKKWKRAPKALSDQYLNTVFGWAPLVDDVTKVCDVALNTSDFIANAKRVNGEWQRRKWREQEVVQEDVLGQTTATSNFCTPALGPGWVVPNSGVLKFVRQQVKRTWYEGSFKQYYPEFDDSLMGGHPALAAVAQRVRLYGLEVNPVNVYKILPYSWLVDWGGSVGDFLQRVSDMGSDAVVSRYFYLMRHTYIRYVYRATWSLVSGGSVSVEAYGGREMKRRVVGDNAFGFSANPGGLSGKQLTILAALGMSRS